METSDGRWLATAIGSLPHTDAAAACELVLTTLRQAPAWPQLPRRDFHENMYVQYSEGLPGCVIDRFNAKIYCEKQEGFWQEAEAFYEDCVENRTGRFAISPDFAAGLYEFVERVKQGERTYPILKGQVTGPISFGLTVTDENNRPILYDETYCDLLVRLLGMKARWMRDLLVSTGLAERVLIFFDEPYLSMVGSALVSIDPDFVVEALDRCVEQVEGLTGVHCCGNTDWSLLLRSQVDIINFDACEYLENLALYPRELQAFLERGGRLAWGLVPNSERVFSEDSIGLRAQLKLGLALLVERGIPEELLRRGMLVTPSCGLDGAEVDAAEAAYKMTGEFVEELNEEWLE
jgi:methionine synthase II (cobalamin-independent)